jgi:zinc finger protein
MEYNAERIDLPFFGESLETMLRCPACGYRHTDFVLTQMKDPCRYTYHVTRADDMSVRVVRSASGTIRMPELGVTIEPGIASEAFISNVEGVLGRVERVLDQFDRDAEDEGMRERIAATRRAFNDLRAGRGAGARLILEDPFGNSAILHDDARKQALTPAEVARLNPGLHIVDPDTESADG